MDPQGFQMVDGSEKGYTTEVVLIHLSKGQLSKDYFVQRTLLQEDFCPRRYWSKQTVLQGKSLKHLGMFILFFL